MAGLSWESLLEQTVQQMVSFALGGAVTPVLAPLSQGAANIAWQKLPNMPLPAEAAAGLVVVGKIDDEQGFEWASQQGFGPKAWDALKLSTETPATLDILFQLFLRGKIDADGLLVGIARLGFEPGVAGVLGSLTETFLSPAEAAQARQQGFITEDEQHAYAAKFGVGDKDAELQFDINGLPPGIGEGLELLRRNKITKDRFAEYVFQGNTKRQYLGDLLELVNVPLSPAVAVEGAIRERISPEEAFAIAAKSGLSQDDFDIWLSITGRAMGIGQALTLVRRGEYTPEQFDAVVARSDVRPEYAPDLIKLATVYPPLFQVIRLVTSGGLSDELATEALTKEGYAPEFVTALVRSAHKSKTTTTKHVAASTIESLYIAGLEKHPEAIKALEVLGYTADDAEEYLDVWTGRRIVSELVHGVTQIRTRYTGWKITAAVAKADLVDFGQDPPTIDRLLKWWGNERIANKPQLTTAQVAAGMKYGRYTYDEALQRLLLLGWDEDSALTVLWNEMHGDPRPKVVGAPAP